ncbi:hypothetical protein GCM10009619_41720 [Williamsia maris]
MSVSSGPSVFRKRTYTLGHLASDARVLASRRKEMKAIWAEPRLDPQLREQVMVAVATVNACGFCTYIHHETALQVGADVGDLASLIDQSDKPLDDDAIVAIMWAQRYAETGFGEIGELLEHALAQRFTEEQRRDIETVVRVMTLNNLCGNTLEALVRRLRGNRVTHSRLIDELVIGVGYFLGAVPQGLLTARMRGKSPAVAFREARAAIAAAA